MFGKHFEAAEATILFVKYHSSGSIFAKDPRDRSATFEVILEVCTQDGQPFRTEIRQFFERPPHVGDVVRVQYDPKSKQVKVVTKGDARYDVRAFVHATDLAAKAEHDALLAAPAGTPVPLPQAAQQTAADEEQSRFALEEHKKRRNELLLIGYEGIATVLSIQERRVTLPPLFDFVIAVPPLVCYRVEVEFFPRIGGTPVYNAPEAWLDPGNNPIIPGSTVRIRYNPKNFFDMIILET
ncbi:MAG TPA: hypothetical protein VFN35_16605 [Ktedonobacteraceae bacterium]|nr:hypothetical protein [Ktedonobacteraceae bacterium]